MSDRRIKANRPPEDEKPETPFGQLSPRVKISLPTLRFGYAGKPVHYFNGALYVNGRPVRRRDRW